MHFSPSMYFQLTFLLSASVCLGSLALHLSLGALKFSRIEGAGVLTRVFVSA